MKLMNPFGTNTESPEAAQRSAVIESIGLIFKQMDRLEQENEDLKSRLAKMEYMLESTMRDAGEIA